MLALTCLLIHNVKQLARRGGKCAYSFFFEYQDDTLMKWSTGFEEIECFFTLFSCYFQGWLSGHQQLCLFILSEWLSTILESFLVFPMSGWGEDKCCLSLTLPTLYRGVHGLGASILKTGLSWNEKFCSDSLKDSRTCCMDNAGACQRTLQLC